MEAKWDLVGEEGLRFFGHISASISHEIKNTLAIMNENIGLLKDFCSMARKGKAVDFERFESLAGRVAEQIRRADDIVKNMNQFAHSVDEDSKGVDLEHMTASVAALTGRIASMRGKTLDVQTSSNPVQIVTSPFFLENLIWLCLDFAIEVSGPENTVGIIAEKKEGGGCIRFTRLGGLSAVTPDSFPTAAARALVGALGAEIEIHPEAAEIVLTLPAEMHRTGPEHSKKE
jgi:C4-dicarboxylate-specific signal transduction histidine kinase